MSNKMRIGGKTYNIPDGANISVVGDVVLVNGKKFHGDEIKIENVIIEGDTGPIRADGSVTVKGKIDGSIKAGGSVNAGDIWGDVDAGGSVHAGNIKGRVSAGGSVKAGKIG